MSKGGQIAIIVLVVVVLIGGALTGLLLGVRASNTYYVCFEVNPRVEFLTNKKGVVKSVKPINEDARILLCGEDYVGKNIKDVAGQWITLCEQTGYLDVDGKDNAIKVTVIAGLTQSFENDVVSKVYEKIINDNIYCVVTENQNDLANYKNAKKEGVNAEKYDLMCAVVENGGYTMQDVKSKSNKKLIEIIKSQHANYNPNYDEADKALKQSLINTNKTKYNNHIKCITNKTTKQFKTEYDKFLKSNIDSYQVDYLAAYERWQYMSR